MQSTLLVAGANPEGKVASTPYFHVAPRLRDSPCALQSVPSRLFGRFVACTRARAPPVFDASPYDAGVAAPGPFTILRGARGGCPK